MTLRYGMWIGRPLCNRTDPLCAARRPELNAYSMDYVRYLFQLRKALSTNTAKAIALGKQQEQELIFEHFEALCLDRMPTYDEAFLLLEQLEARTDSLAVRRSPNEPRSN